MRWLIAPAVLFVVTGCSKADPPSMTNDLKVGPPIQVQRGGIPDDSIKPAVQRGGVVDDGVKPAVPQPQQIQRGGTNDDSVRPVLPKK